MSSTLSEAENLRQHPVVQTLLSSHQRLQSQLVLSSSMPVSEHIPHDFVRTSEYTGSDGSNNVPTLWLSCSGGRDSLGLAYALTLVREHIQLPISVIHVNHHLQTQSSAWAERVRVFCGQYGLDYSCVHVTLDDGSENSARKARFQAISEQIKSNDVLVLGHHADDQAETVLMNLCKGTGLAGLSAMSECGFFSNQSLKPHWRWRPWLTVTRDAITDFCVQAELEYVDDPTNVAGDNTRAFIRREIMPILMSKWSSANANIARTASIVSEAKQMLDAQTQSDLSECMNGCEIDDELNLTKFSQLPLANQHAVISQWLQGDNAYAPARHIVLKVANLATAKQHEIADTRTQIDWQDSQIRRYDDTLYKLSAKQEMAITRTVGLNIGQVMSLPNGNWQVCRCADFDDAEELVGLSAELLTQSIEVRPVQAGERLHIYGRVGSWPLKKFFQQCRLPPWQRKQAQIICVDAQPVALLCHRGMFVVHDHASSDKMAWSLKRL